MTAQFHERLIFKGEEATMNCEPPIPAGHPRIEETGSESCESTACWRGYIGTWEVKNGCFYLVGIEGKYRMTGKGPLKAVWFTGTISIPQGKLINYVHLGFMSTYEKELRVDIDRGRVVSILEIVNTPPGRSKAKLPHKKGGDRR